MKNLIILSSLLAVAACGGAKKGATIGTGKEPPPPPSVGHHNDIATPGNPATAKVEVSADAKKDYNAAIEFFRNSDKNGWNESACKASADRFGSVVKEHSDLVAAQFLD